MKKTELYPLKFEPILKEKVWGGEKLHTIFQKHAVGNIGESWELSGVSGSVSKVANGHLKGNSLNHLVDQYGDALLGKRVKSEFGVSFPLLFKFIDAREDLSVQLHPDDVLARVRHDSFGKTEMWYIIDCDEGARLILGFDRDMDMDTYKKFLSEKKITEILRSEAIKPGDTFFIAPGTVHAIGAGTLLAEIQQTSDITYRIYDWDRPDKNGNMRELHNELALDAIDFNAGHPKLPYEDKSDQPVLLCTVPFFETNKLILTRPMERDHGQLDSFRVYMCVEGEAEIRYNQSRTPLKRGETVLIPACCDKVLLKTNSATLLEVYIP